jgi:menaquinol-cytochrome c reductase iron-sulfur subunit
MSERPDERRRSLLRLAGAIAAGGTTFVGLQRWTTRPRQAAPLPPSAVRLGPSVRFAEGLTLVAEHRIVIVRRGSTYDALSAICSHQGCTVKPSADGARLECPCHLGIYDATGRIISGDAPVGLRRYRTFVASDTGDLIVDRAL